ncbi:MalY/PatB family protein [Polynucleobacter sp. MG-27-Goln-C1]|uniref:MalY/PatB family protein n=1 Tax=Polynucleobacter sp. MG-27-Goln-C1 TaxID=1819726 RepID=UPI001C0D03A7|nr:PatB family C-S lyase [Polynucleobacter sp. MG-27-Goln-C1]MBU3612162.1 putative C-S lyase [Polynucleobacter sp. MG-27-Goln-C1]
MAFDFDAPTNRLETDSIRWDSFGVKEVLPLWVADMDFKSPPCVIEALNKRVQQGIYGYTHSPHQMNALIAGYLQEQYQWQVDPDWIVILPSVVSGLYTAVQQLSNSDENVLIPNPVYHHLRLACTSSNRPFQEMPLELKDDRWVLPSNGLSGLLNGKTKLALFCNPQNPGSTVFTKEELQEFGDFCVQNNLWICSDEIHAGLVLDENKKHIPLASISKDISKQTVTLMSLNKTFNFPGIGLAWAVAENPILRKAIQVGLHQTIAPPSLLAYTATMAAITEGEPWRQELIEYLRGNQNRIHTRISAIPGLKVDKMEGSYLAWIDCSSLNLPDPYQLLLDAGLATSPGSQFGRDQFVRLNFGTQRSRLNQALDILEKTFS